MYNTNGKLKFTSLCRFPASTFTKPNCAWLSATGGKWRVGTVNGNVWREIENAWALDTFGSWIGPPPLLIQPKNLRVLGTDGAKLPTVREGFDMVYRAPSSELFTLMWEKQISASLNEGINPSRPTVTIYSASSGAVVAESVSPNTPWTPSILANGSYTVHVIYKNLSQGLSIPEGAYRDPAFDYTTQDLRLSHYNPYENWGEVPASPNHPLRLLRLQLVASNQTRDIVAYSSYITSEEEVDGQGSMIKLVVGSGLWTNASGIFPTPNRALYELDFTQPIVLDDSLSTPIPIAFDALAVQVTQCLTTRSGRQLIAGSRMNDQGTHPAVWEWDETTESATILGVADNACGNGCEQLLSTGSVTGLVELADSSIVIITLCSCHRLDETNAISENRLPRYPSETYGEPGGRSLVSVGQRIVYLTERFGGQPDLDSWSFYNIGIEVKLATPSIFPGTVAHVEGALWFHQGKSYGIRANKPPTDADTKIYITYYDGSWNKRARPWRVDWMYLNRGASINGRMLAFGYVSGENTARVVLNTGKKEMVLECDYRVRQAFLTAGSRAGYKQLVAPGRKIVDNVFDSGWSVVVTEGFTEDEVIDPPPGGGGGGGIQYRVVSLEASPNSPVYCIYVHDCSENKSLTSLNIASNLELVRARVDSTDALNDFDSFIYRCPVGEKFSLPIEAYQKVEVLVLWDSAIDGDLELPQVARVI